MSLHRRFDCLRTLLRKDFIEECSLGQAKSAFKAKNLTFSAKNTTKTDHQQKTLQSERLQIQEPISAPSTLQEVAEIIRSLVIPKIQSEVQKKVATVIADALANGETELISATMRKRSHIGTLDNRTVRDVINIILEEIASLKVGNVNGVGKRGWKFEITEEDQPHLPEIETDEQAAPLIEALIKKGPIITIRKISTKEKEGYSKKKANANAGGEGIFAEKVAVVPKNNPLYDWGIRKCAVSKRGAKWVIGEDRAVVIIAEGRRRGQPCVVSLELIKHKQR